MTEVPPTVGQSALTRQVALTALSVRRFDPSDADLAQMLGGVMRKDRRNAIVIEVTTADPLDARPRAGLPVIELNGRTLADTRIRPDGHRLVAVVPERAIGTERNLVAVVWLGSETATRTREPLSFGPEDIGE